MCYDIVASLRESSSVGELAAGVACSASSEELSASLASLCVEGACARFQYIQ